MSENKKREMKVDYLYIDLSTCNRCLGTDTALYEAIRDTNQILKTSGIELTLTKTLVETEAQAAELGFLTSPTIRINGRDMQADFQESVCESSCGVVEDGGVLCREWNYQGKIYNTAPKGMIVDAILKEVYAGEKEPLPEGSHRIPVEELPANLKNWFAALRQSEQEGATAAAACGTSCCGPTPAVESSGGSCCG
ncbi:MAG: DUF2703 domain-containing protein [Deltaproteobacteria bacterium]|nr:MAG: DUF2703 domain-containing protein [Deltaproteobacteria bacterium]